MLPLLLLLVLLQSVLGVPNERLTVLSHLSRLGFVVRRWAPTAAGCLRKALNLPAGLDHQDYQVCRSELIVQTNAPDASSPNKRMVADAQLFCA
jgi:hypothetical protein